MDPSQNLMPHVPSAAPAGAPGAQPVIVIMQAPSSGETREAKREHYKKTFPEKAILAMSVWSLVSGFLSILIQIILICSSRYAMLCYMQFVGQGIWSGIFFLIAGSIGIWAAKKPSQCSIITLMVMSIVSACMSIPHIVLDSIGLSISVGYRSSDCGYCAGLYGLMLVFGLTTGIVLIVISAYTCRTTCCSTVKTNGTVMYHPSTAQTIQLGDLSHVITNAQQVMYPPQQQSPPPTYSSDGAHHQSSMDANRMGGDDSKYKRFD